jgi:uncharacterized RDD family membrane protein YckC
MESIDIITGQHITIKYEPASIIRRACGLVLDYLFIYLYVMSMIYVMSDSLYSIDSFWGYIFMFLLSSPAVFYHFLFESFMGGRTPGKMITRTRVSNTDGSTPGLTAYFLRWILMPVDLFPSGAGLGALFIIFTRKHQRIGDMAAGTVVVRNIKPPQLDIEKDFIEFSPDYKPTFSQVELLSDNQVRFISHYLFDPLNKKAVTNSIHALSDKVKVLLKIETALDDRTFLETIVRDYNYYATL